MMHDVVFVIPVYNTPAEILKTTITNLAEQTRHPIYLVNDGSSNVETLRALNELEKLPNVKVLHKQHEGKISAIMYALTKLNAKYVFILDDDAIIKNSLDKTLDQSLHLDISNFLEKDYIVVVYPVGSLYLRNVLEKVQHVEHIIPTYYVRKLLNEGLYINGTGSLWNASKLLEILKKHSGMHEGDDLELTLLTHRYRLRIAFSDSLILLAVMKDNLLSWFIQRMKWEYGKWRLLLKYFKDIINDPYIFAYYFASLFLLISIILQNIFVTLVLSAILFYTILSRINRLKQFNKIIGDIYLIVLPLLTGLLVKFPLNIIIGMIYYYILFKIVQKEAKIRVINLVLFIMYYTYIIVYMLIIQPVGLIYVFFRKIKNALNYNLIH